MARTALAGLDRKQFAIYPGVQMKMLGMFGSVGALPAAMVRSQKIATVHATSRRGD